MEKINFVDFVKNEVSYRFFSFDPTNFKSDGLKSHKHDLWLPSTVLNGSLRVAYFKTNFFRIAGNSEAVSEWKS